MPAAARSMLLSVAMTLVATASAWSAESPGGAASSAPHGRDGRGTVSQWQHRPIAAGQTGRSSPSVPAAGGQQAYPVRQSAGTTALPKRPVATGRFRRRDWPPAAPSASTERDAPNRPAVTQQIRPPYPTERQPPPARSPSPQSSAGPGTVRAATEIQQAPGAGREHAENMRPAKAPSRISSTPLRLTPPSTPARSGGNKPAVRRAGPSIITMVSSLTLVLSLLMVCMWVLRRSSRPAAVTRLPEAVLEVLGRSTLFGRQQLYLLRLGNKLLLLSVTAAGTETLAEITDGTEIDRIVGLCRQNQPGSVAASFRQVLTQLSHAPGHDRIEKAAANKGRVRVPTQGLAPP